MDYIFVRSLTLMLCGGSRGLIWAQEQRHVTLRPNVVVRLWKPRRTTSLCITALKF